MAGLDATDTGNELSQPKFECTDRKVSSRNLGTLLPTHLLSPLLVDGLLAGDALYEPHVVQLALRLVLHPLPLLRLGLQARDDRPQGLHLLPHLKTDLTVIIRYFDSKLF